MTKALAICPICDGALAPSELQCARCKATIRSEFEPCRFCRLGPEHLGFIETFLRCEGNLSRVEKELNLSYPTVRNRFSAAIAALGFAEGGAQEPAREESVSFSEKRRVLLEQLSRGEISAEDVALAL